MRFSVAKSRNSRRPPCLDRDAFKSAGRIQPWPPRSNTCVLAVIGAQMFGSAPSAPQTPKKTEVAATPRGDAESRGRAAERVELRGRSASAARHARAPRPRRVGDEAFSSSADEPRRRRRADARARVAARPPRPPRESSATGEQLLSGTPAPRHASRGRPCFRARRRRRRRSCCAWRSIGDDGRRRPNPRSSSGTASRRGNPGSPGTCDASGARPREARRQIEAYC